MENKPNKDQVKSIQTILEKQLTLIDGEKEEYILTQEDEIKVLLHELKITKEGYRQRLLLNGHGPREVENKMAMVDWDEILAANKDEILQRANSFKHQELWHKSMREKEVNDKLEKEKQLKADWPAKKIFSLMKYVSKNEFRKDFKVYDHQKNLITAICYFLSEDEKFETELGYSFTKGLLIRGTVGVGKTHVVRCAADNGLNHIAMFSMIDISEEISNNGKYILDLDGRKKIYLDDVGTEEPVINYYGSKINWFKSLIERIYLRGGYNNLIVSTNLSFNNMGQYYGFRVESRAREMFNVIDVAGNDLRIQN